MNWRVPYIIIAFGYVSCASAQEPAIIEALVQEITETGAGSDAEQLFEMLSLLAENPVNLNTSSEEELTATGLFTPFQVFGITEHRKKYGPFLTIFELSAIPGFNDQFLELIGQLVTCSGTNPAPDSRPSSGMILSNISVKFPVSVAYHSTDSTTAWYPGPPVKTTHRFSYSVGSRYKAAFTFDRDAGETIFNQGRPEHLSGYLQIKPGNTFNRLLIGNFSLHRGLGLVHGTGFTTRSTGFQLNGYRRSYARPFASSMEYNYYRGCYAELSAGVWSADFFLSFRQPDLSLFRFDTSEVLFEKIRKTGLHRTISERNGTGLANLFVIGGAVNRSGKHHYSGLAFTRSQIGLSRTGRDSLGISTPLNACRSNISIYSVGYWPWIEICAETAIDNDMDVGLITSATLNINPAMQASISAWHYQPGFSGQLSNAYGSGSDPENETGISLGIKLTPFECTRLSVHTDLDRPLVQMAYNDPYEYDTRYYLLLTHEAKPGGKFEFRCTAKETECPVAATSKRDGTLRSEQLHRYRFQYTFNLTERMILSCRWVHSVLQNSSGPNHSGLVYLQGVFEPSEHFRITYRYMMFDAPEWENRIYVYEPGTRYSFSFPAWNGKGTRNLVVMHKKKKKRLTLHGKLGITQYAHHRGTGSGYDLRKGNMVSDLELQLQVNLR